MTPDLIRALTPIIMILSSVGLVIFGVSQHQLKEISPLAIALGSAGAGAAEGPTRRIATELNTTSDSNK
jgi:hypothetical protein